MCKYRVQAYDPFGFKKLKDVWDKLYEGKDMTYFQSYDWYEIINSMIPLKGEVLYLVVSNGLQPILIAPLWILRRTFGFINKKGRYFFGRGGYTDYLNFIYKSFDPLALDAIFVYVRTNYGISRYFLECMPEYSASYQYIVRTKTVVKIHQSICVKLALPDSSSQYENMLSKHVRQNLRTAKNRCQKSGLVLTQTFYKETTDRLLIDNCKMIREMRLDLKTSRAKKQMSLMQKCRNNVERILKYQFPVYHVLDVHTQGWLLTITCQDELCAFFHGGYDMFRNSLVVMCAGVNPKFARYSPGLLSMYNQIKIFLEEQHLDSIDFTRGNEKYKYDLGGKDEYIYHVQFKV